MAAPRALVLGVLLLIAVSNTEAASVVVGMAKCADCTRKNMKAEEAFKGKICTSIVLYMSMHTPI